MSGPAQDSATNEAMARLQGAGLSLSEIGARYGITKQAVRCRIDRARSGAKHYRLRKGCVVCSKPIRDENKTGYCRPCSRNHWNGEPRPCNHCGTNLGPQRWCIDCAQDRRALPALEQANARHVAALNAYYRSLAECPA